MLCYRSLFTFVPRRLMASSSSGKTPAKNSQEIWRNKQKDESSIQKSDHGTDDPNDNPCSGQTKVNYNHDGVGFKQASVSRDTYLNPLLTPPPRSPRTAEDFSHPMRLGHWISFGFDWSNPVRDKYIYHEIAFLGILGAFLGLWSFYYQPDMRYLDWARREAFLRTAKREALGLPLIDRNLIDPERMVLPTEEEIGDFPVKM